MASSSAGKLTLGKPWRRHWVWRGSPTSSASFDTFIPSLQNGRFNSSFTSFIVTGARTKVINIVSLYNVGTGFAAKIGSSVKTVNSNVDLCGDTVAVIVASAFIGQIGGLEPRVQERRQASDQCPDLPVGRRRRTCRRQRPGQPVRHVGGRHRLADSPDGPRVRPGAAQPATRPEGVGVSKGIGLDKPIAQAVNHLIATGSYRDLMSKWGVTGGLLTRAVDYQ